MYCSTYVNLYDVIRSIIPCDKLHKHQFSGNFHSTTMASSMLRSAGNGNSNTGETFLYHGTGTFRKSTSGLLRNFLGLMVPINCRVELKACFCRIKWLTSNIRQNRHNSHMMWESTIATISSWASTAWAVFPRPVCVTIRTNLIGLPLLRVVNNSDRWMRKAWEWREAKHVVQTRFGTRLSAIDYAAVRTAQQFRKLCCR